VVEEIELHGADWGAADDFYAAYFAAVGAPEWHGRNLDALWDSLTGISVITTGRGLTSGWTSNARFPGRSPVPGGLFKSPNLEGYTTAMNVSQREGLGADGIMANDSLHCDRTAALTILSKHKVTGPSSVHQSLHAQFHHHAENRNTLTSTGN
jgi:Barstar (barnase inhibitor)